MTQETGKFTISGVCILKERMDTDNTSAFPHATNLSAPASHFLYKVSKADTANHRPLDFVNIFPVEITVVLSFVTWGGLIFGAD